MGGVLVNGCGAADSYYKIKDLGAAYCNSCKKIQPMALMEVKMKIQVLWIPTVPISTKYAVTCAVCKNGYYVNEQQKNDILRGYAEVKMTSEGLELHSTKEPQRRQMAETGVTREQEPTEEQPPAERRFCCQCGKLLDQTTGLCPACDSREKVQSNPTEIRGDKEQESIGQEKKGLDAENIFHFSRGKICPTCQLLYSHEKEVCDICGRSLVERK